MSYRETLTNNKLQTIINSLTPLLMYHYSGNLYALVIVTLLPIIVSMGLPFHYITEFFCKEYINNIHEYNFNGANSGYREQNILFRLCRTLVEKEGKSLISDVNSTTNVKNGLISNIDPQYTERKIKSFMFSRESFCVNINYSEVEKITSDNHRIDRSYIIKAKSNAHLENFIDYLKDVVAMEYIKQKKKNIYQYTYVGKSELSQFVALTSNEPTLNISGWEPNPINSNKKLSNVIMEQHIKQSIVQKCEEVFNYTHNINNAFKMGKPLKNTLLLVGPPGTGKTSIAYALAAEFYADIFKVDAAILHNNIRALNKIPERSIILFDEFDTMAETKTKSLDDTNVIKYTGKDVRDENDMVSQLLSILDSYANFRRCIVILTANDINKVDKRLLRPGRIDLKIDLDFFGVSQVVDTINTLCECNIEASHLPQFITPVNPAELINNIIYPNISNIDAVLKAVTETYSMPKN